MITVSAKMLEEFKKARAEGKKLTPLMERAIADAEEAEGPGAPKVRIIAALYLLGASLGQIANSFGIKRPTVWSYVRDQLPLALRVAAGEERQARRIQPSLGPIMEMADLDVYRAAFGQRRKEFRDMDATRIAAALKAAVVLTADRADSLEVAEPGDPYA